MIVADLPEKRRKVYHMVHQYAERYNLTFKEAVDELKEVAQQLTVRIKGKTE
ncbi:hypothetical protein [Rahnella bonaserana]